MLVACSDSLKLLEVLGLISTSAGMHIQGGGKALCKKEGLIGLFSIFSPDTESHCNPDLSHLIRGAVILILCFISSPGSCTNCCKCFYKT